MKITKKIIAGSVLGFLCFFCFWDCKIVFYAMDALAFVACVLIATDF
jgi:hypothetical protein